MGLFNLLTGHSSAIRDIERHDPGLAAILFEGEQLDVAFKLLRDYVAFTTHRIIVVDRQGMTGRKRSYLSITYGRIMAFSIETKGTMDLDAELRVHVQGLPEPLALQFGDNDAAQLVQRGMAAKVCA